MCNEKLIRGIAGVLVLASLALGVWLHAGWFFLTAFVGFNLFQSSLTDFCPLERILGALKVCGCQPRSGKAV